MAHSAGEKRSIVVGRYRDIMAGEMTWHVFVTIPDEAERFFERYYGGLEGRTYETDNAMSGSREFHKKYGKWQRFVGERNPAR